MATICESREALGVACTNLAAPDVLCCIVWHLLRLGGLEPNGLMQMQAIGGRGIGYASTLISMCCGQL